MVPSERDPRCGRLCARRQAPGSTQLSDRSTARCQPWSKCSRRSVVIAGSNRRSTARVATNASASDQTPTPRPARPAAPSAVVSACDRPFDLDAEEVGLELAQPIVAGRSAVDPEDVERGPGIGGHRIHDIGDLVGHGVDRGARDLGQRRSRG